MASVRLAGGGPWPAATVMSPAITFQSVTTSAFAADSANNSANIITCTVRRNFLESSMIGPPWLGNGILQARLAQYSRKCKEPQAEDSQSPSAAVSKSCRFSCSDQRLEIAEQRRQQLRDRRVDVHGAQDHG